MKKIRLVLCCCILVITLTGCSSKSQSEVGEITTSREETTILEKKTKSETTVNNSNTNMESKENKNLIVIDAGHQTHGDSSQEPVGPGAKETKNKVTGGTSGTYTGVPEYKLNLVIALKLKKELHKRGYKIF